VGFQRRAAPDGDDAPEPAPTIEGASAPQHEILLKDKLREQYDALCLRTRTLSPRCELELELILSHMTQKPMLRGEVGARARSALLYPLDQGFSSEVSAWKGGG
jgi:hypothetical protein